MVFEKNGKNLYVFRRSERFNFCLGCRFEVSRNEQLGVDVSSPTWIIYLKNKDRIAGGVFWPMVTRMPLALLLSFGAAKVPVFGTIELLNFVSNDSAKKFNDFHVIDQNSEIDFGDAVVSSSNNPLHPRIGIVIALLRVISSTGVLNLTKLPASRTRQTLLT